MIKKIPKLLIVDDEKNIRQGLKQALHLSFYIQTAGDALEALDILENNNFDVVLTDVKMPKINGIDFVKEVKKKRPQTICVMMTAYGSIETAVEAMKVGAKDFVTKPLNIDNLEERLFMSLNKQEPKQKSQESVTLPKLSIPIIGQSEKFKETLSMVQKVAPTKVTVLLTGESGTGKEIFAQAIHELSPRKTKPFIAVHCQSFNENLIESELFGYEKGAFTNAHSRHIGRFESAHSGTLFLDEIGDIDLNTQVKLLRVLETRSFERLGGKEPIKVDVRLVTATNRNLKELVKQGKFREDLYYRLNVFSLPLPALRERIQDIELLANHFLQQNELGKKYISKEALQCMQKYHWYGNIRELKNVIEHSCIISSSDSIQVGDLPQDLVQNVKKPSNLSLDDNEKNIIENTLKETKYNKTKAASILGINRRTLYRKIKLYQLEEAED